MKLVTATLIALGLLGGGTGFYVVQNWLQGNGSASGGFRTAPVERGLLLATVSATGTVQAENVVDVGAQNQVPLQIKSFGLDVHRVPRANRLFFVGLMPGSFNPVYDLYLNPRGPIDFCSPVRKDQVLATLDKALYLSQRDQAKAEVANATYNLAKLKADLVQMQAKANQANAEWDRARRLRGTIAATDYDLAQANYSTTRAVVDAAGAALSSAEENLSKAKAALEQADTNLGYCTIKSPINGVVIDRRVNVGQTVVSAQTASSLFLIAEDLSRLEVWASVNEADYGAISVGQEVRFTVDAYPNESFYGQVKEIRLNAQMTQNVVTFPVVVSVNNSSMRLVPYMTANLQFEVSQRANALMVPNAALRWKPQASQVAADIRAAYAKSLLRGPLPKPTGDKAKDKDATVRVTVWVIDGKHVRPVRVKIGLTDGNVTEVLEVVDGALPDGQSVVTGVAIMQTEDTVNPFAPQLQKSNK